MSDLFSLYVEAGSSHGDDQPQSAQRWAADEIVRLTRKLELYQALGLPEPGEELIHGLNNEGFRLLGSKESVEHFKSEYEGATARWIDVGDRLPESKPDMWSEPVIALADNMKIFELSCMGSYWQRSKAFVDSGAQKVICWIPFPKLPEN